MRSTTVGYRTGSVALLVGFWMVLPFQVAAQGTPGLQSLNPDISVIGDFLADFSPDEPEVSEEGRFSLREIELATQAAVDPFFRADFFLSVHEGDLDVEEAYVTALSLPGELQARIGRVALPLGRVNLTHRPELLTPEYPLVLRTDFGAEGLSGTGIGLSRIFAPFGFFQEFQLFLVNGSDLSSGVDQHHDQEAANPSGSHVDADAQEELRVGGGARSGLEQVALIGHLRNFYDLSVATNVEVGFSLAAGTVDRLRPVSPSDVASASELDAIRHFSAQHYYGLNTTVRWRPPAQALYRSFIWSTEWLASSGPESTVSGGFTGAEWQIGRRTFLGARVDAVQRPGFQIAEVIGEGMEGQVHIEDQKGGEWMYEAAGGLTFFPSEFSRFRLWGGRIWGEGYSAGDASWRLVFQTTFAIGPHRPHAF